MAWEQKEHNSKIYKKHGEKALARMNREGGTVMTEEKKVVDEKELDEKQLDEVSGGSWYEDMLAKKYESEQ